MANAPRHDLKARLNASKLETVLGANSAARVFQMVLDLLDNVPVEFDPAEPYEANVWAIWQGRLVKSFAPTLAGQSPATHPALWTDPVISSASQLVEGAPNLPVLRSALMVYVAEQINALIGAGGSVPLATDLVAGLVKRATEALVNEGIDNSTYVTPLLLNRILTQVLVALNHYFTPVGDTGLETDRDLLANNFSVPSAGRPPVGVIPEGARGPAFWYPTAEGAHLTTVEATWEAFREKLEITLKHLYDTSPAVDSNSRLSNNNSFINITQQGVSAQPGLYGYFTDGLIEWLSFFFGRFFDGSVGFVDSQGNKVRLISDGALDIVARFIQTNAEMALRNVFRSALPVAQTIPDNALSVWSVPQPGGGPRMDIGFTFDTFLGEVASRLGVTPVQDDILDVLEVCEIQPPPLTYRKRITPDMLGVEQTHGLNTPEADLFVILQDVTGQLDSTMIVSHPSDNTYQIDYPEGITSGYTGGKLRIEA